MNVPTAILAGARMSLALIALVALGLGLDPSPTRAAGLPVSPSAYGVGRVCAEPAPGYSGCMGLQLVPNDPAAVPGTEVTPQVIEHTKPLKGSLTPANLISAYGLTGATPPSTQTIALVDAYDSATIAADLEVFNSQYGLPACNEANGCFSKVNQNGNASPLPPSSGENERGWALEIATDVEIAHGVCPSCRILLVEAKSNANFDLYTAEQTAAVALGADEISNSWGGEEGTVDSSAFNHPGTVITASSGDYGYLDWFSEEPSEFANYPASSPHVIAVGGTRLTLSAAKTWESETVWNDGGFNGFEFEGAGAGGGGCSGRFVADSWQQGVPNWSSMGCGAARAVTDISADGDPYTGVAVYDSTETEGEKGWFMIGGTSVASPIIASIFALAGGAQGYAYPAQMLYENQRQNPASLHDVTAGSNGECLKEFKKNGGVSGCTSAEEAQSCTSHLICLAAPGYDGPSGVGTPNGLAAFKPPTGGGEHATVPAPAPPSSEPAPTGTSSPGPVAKAAAASPSVSALSLTRSALAALRKQPRLSKLGFAFTLNLSARVRVTLARRVRVHGRMQWRNVSTPLTFNARSGPQARRLSGRATLPRGRYMLTVAPQSGSSKSIVFRIG